MKNKEKIMERKYGFRERLLQIHKEDVRDFSINNCQEDEIELKSGIQIAIPKECGRVLKNAARDFCDYLLVSMQIGAGITYIDQLPDKKENVVILTTKEFCDMPLNEAEGYMGFAADVDNIITICGYDERGTAQGVYHLEDLMNIRKAPYLKKGKTYRKPMFSPRMVHSGYGLDNFPDAHLAEIAHSGRDAILVYVRDYQHSANTYMDLNEIIYRAEGYGIDVYAYSYMKSPYNSEDDGAYAYYEGTYGALFGNCPKLKGVVLVGESVSFPTSNKAERGGNFIYGERESEGHYSRDYLGREYPAWVSMLQDIIYKRNPDADIVLWSYNFNCEPGRLDMIRNLPKGVSLLVTFEMPQLVKSGNSMTVCRDYTISFEGPGINFLEEAKVAKECGVRLYSMVNTAGRTWDIGAAPYLPCPMQWKRRNDNILDCMEKYGLTGLMESHHFGFHPSIISELAKEAFTVNGMEFDDISRKLAARDFGEENVDKVIAAWEKFSEGIRCTPTATEDQYGPLRCGPTYPLTLTTPHSIASSAPYAQNGGEAIVRPKYQAWDDRERKNKGRTVFPIRVYDEIKLLEKGIKLFDEGVAILEEIAVTDNARRMTDIAHFIANTLKTTLSAKKWYVLKNKLLSVEADKEEINRVAREMRAIAEAEIKNSEDTLPLVDRDSNLGWEPSMEYIADRAHIEMKIRQVKVMLDFDLSLYEE